MRKQKGKAVIVALVALGVTAISLIGHSDPIFVQQNLSQYVHILAQPFVAIPHIFQANATASANQVNANFKSVMDALNGSFVRESGSETVGILGRLAVRPSKKPTIDSENCMNMGDTPVGGAELEGSDTAGKVYFPQSIHTVKFCKILFSKPYKNGVTCTASRQSWPPKDKPVNVNPEDNGDGVTFYASDGFNGDAIHYICVGR